MNKRHYEHTLPNIRGSLSNTYVAVCFPVLDSVAVGHAITYASHLDLLRLAHKCESEEDG